MNFYKKIIIAIVTLSIVASISLTRTSYPSVYSTETEIDLDLVEFKVNYNIYFELIKKNKALSDVYNKMVDESIAISDDISDLRDQEMDFSPYEVELYPEALDNLKEQEAELYQEALDNLKEQEEILDKGIDNIMERSSIISELQGNVVKIKAPSKKLLAQEIVDKLKEIDNLKVEEIKLLKKYIEYFYSHYKDWLSLSQGKMTFERVIEIEEERIEENVETSERLDELRKAIRSLKVEIRDLKAKLDSLEMLNSFNISKQIK